MSTSYTTHSAHDARGPSGTLGKEEATTTGEVGGLQRVQVAQIPSAVRQAICTLLVGQGLDAQKCERILEQLLRYARVWQRSLEEGGDVAVISIGNLLQLHKRDRWTCCCYQTANTFIRLLCALQLLRKHRGPGGATEYYLPLAEGFVFQPNDDMLTALNRLRDPAQTKNKRVRYKAADVKSRLLLLHASSRVGDQPQVEQAQDAELADLTDKMRDALAQVEGLLHSVGKLEGRMRKQVMAGIGTVLVDLLQDVRKSTRVVDSWTSGWRVIGQQDVDSVDSRRSGKTAKRLALTRQGQRESTGLVDSADTQAQNLPLDAAVEVAAHEAGEAGRAGEAERQNLPGSGQPVDSGAPIDNGSNIFSNKSLSSSPPPKNNTNTTDKSSVIDSKAAGAGKQALVPGGRVLSPREAKALASFVEGNSGMNFPAYITLSKTCSELAIRAAVVNMMCHSRFPDLDGSIGSEVDGEITGKWGRPRRPGAWVTDLARAYQREGIPAVMMLLLSCFESPDDKRTPYSYQCIAEVLDVQGQSTSAEMFWVGLQRELQAKAQASTQPAERASDSLAPAQRVFESEGMTEDAAQRLAGRIAQEGTPFGITAGHRLQGNAWVVEMQVCEPAGTPGEPDRVVVHTTEMRSEQAWLEYFTLMKELEDVRQEG